MESARTFLIDQTPSHNTLGNVRLQQGSLFKFLVGAASLTSIPGKVSAGKDGDFSLSIIPSPTLNPQQGKKVNQSQIFHIIYKSGG